jgi:hypothetical protein
LARVFRSGRSSTTRGATTEIQKKFAGVTPDTQQRIKKIVAANGKLKPSLLPQCEKNAIFRIIDVDLSQRD